MSSHLYWRAHITAVPPGGFGGAQLAEVQMFDASNNPLCTGGTPIASSSFSGLPASNAFDGNVSTVWASNTAVPAWIGYQFASPVSVATIQLLGLNIDFQSYPSAFTLDYSDDGLTWTTLASFTPPYPGDSQHSPCWSFAAVTPPTNAYCSYRFNVSSVAHPSGTNVAITQAEFYGPGSGLNLAAVPYTLGSWPGGATYASPDMDTFVGNNGSDQAFDGTFTHAWNAGGVPAWLAYNFAVPTVVTSFCLWGAAGNINAPATFTFEGSNDGGATWTVLGTFSFAWPTSPSCAFLSSPQPAQCYVIT